MQAMIVSQCRIAALCFSLACCLTFASLVPSGDPACWVGIESLKAPCCGGGHDGCFDEHHTRERCCGTAAPAQPVQVAASAGDPACWSGDFSFDMCCPRQDDACFDQTFTRERCCGAGAPPSQGPAAARPDGPDDRSPDASSPAGTSEPDPACWSGSFLFSECCFWQTDDCFDEVYTRDRCCGRGSPVASLADGSAGGLAPAAGCWGGGMTFSSCCLRADNSCFDRVYTRERCCRRPVLQFAREKAQWLRGRGLPAVAGGLRGSLFWVFAPALCCALWGCLAPCPADSGRAPAASLPAASLRAPEASIPAASLLRVIATLGVMALQHCWEPSAESPGLEGFRLWLFCLCSVQCDLFFVRAGCLLGSRSLRRDASLSGAAQARATITGAALGILRRVARTAPGAFVAPYAISALRHRALAGPPLAEIAARAADQLAPRGWPLDVELVCLAAVQVLTALAALAGEVAGTSSAVALLAACFRWRLQSGPPPAGQWQQASRSVLGRRLPSAVTALLAARALRSASPGAEPDLRGAGDAGARSWGDAVLDALLWTAAALGVLLAATVEWLVRSGTFSPLLPWWSYPLLAEAPLALGCALLLERSRRLASRRGTPAWMAPVAWLERLSWPALCCHLGLSTYTRRELLSGREDLEALLLTLLIAVSWSYAVGALIFWVGAPYDRALQRLLLAAQELAAAPRWWAWAFSAGLVLSAASVAGWAARAVCQEPALSPSP